MMMINQFNSLPTCACLFRRMPVHSLRRCSGFSAASLTVTLFGGPVVPPGAATPPLLPGNALFAGNCKRPLLPFDGCCWVGMNAAELCSRVLTTSKGHVTTAPTVPAVLEYFRETTLEFDCGNAPKIHAPISEKRTEKGIEREETRSGAGEGGGKVELLIWCGSNLNRNHLGLINRCWQQNRFDPVLEETTFVCLIIHMPAHKERKL